MRVKLMASMAPRLSIAYGVHLNGHIELGRGPRARACRAFARFQVLLRTVYLAACIFAVGSAKAAVQDAGDDAEFLRVQRAAAEAVRDRCELGFVSGVYQLESTTRTQAPTESEIAEVKKYFAPIRSSRERKPSDGPPTGPSPFFRADGMPLALLTAISRAEKPDRRAEATFEFESLTAWSYRRRIYSLDGIPMGRETPIIRNRHGMWLRHAGLDDVAFWTLEAVEEDLASQMWDAARAIEELRVTVRNLARLAIRGDVLFRPLREETASTDIGHGTSAPSKSRVAFALELGDFGLLHRLSSGTIHTPHGWTDVAGFVEISQQDVGDTSQLSLKWLDLHGHPVMYETLWSVGPQHLPERFLRQQFLIGGGRVVYEFDVRCRYIGPLERSPEAFLPPPGATVQDHRPGLEVTYEVSPSGRLPDASDVAATSAAMEAEFSELLAASAQLHPSDVSPETPVGGTDSSAATPVGPFGFPRDSILIGLGSIGLLLILGAWRIQRKSRVPTRSADHLVRSPHA